MTPRGLLPCVLAAATLPACFFSPDTVHVQVRDPAAIALSLGPELVLAAHEDGVNGQAPVPRELTFRTDEDSLTRATVTPARGPERGDGGIVEHWDTRVHLIHGELFEVVGQDGWVAALPTQASIVRRGDVVEIRASRQLSYWSSRSRSGYDVHLGDPALASPGEVLTLSTPAYNIERVERRGNPTRQILGGFLAGWGTLFGGGGLAAVLDPGRKSRNTGRVLGAAFAAIGFTVDGFGLYNLVRGSLHRRVRIPVAP